MAGASVTLAAACLGLDLAGVGSGDEEWMSETYDLGDLFERVVELAAANLARAYGLAGLKGEIAVGADAGPRDRRHGDAPQGHPARPLEYPAGSRARTDK